MITIERLKNIAKDIIADDEITDIQKEESYNE